jgi:hypothetical protein
MSHMKIRRSILEEEMRKFEGPQAGQGQPGFSG